MGSGECRLAVAGTAMFRKKPDLLDERDDVPVVDVTGNGGDGVDGVLEVEVLVADQVDLQTDIGR